MRARLITKQEKASAERAGLCILTPSSNSQMDIYSRKKKLLVPVGNPDPRLREWKQLVFFTRHSWVSDICHN